MRFGTAFLSLILGVALHVNASAKPLSSEECVRLVDEHAKLTRNGIEKSLAQAPPVISETSKTEQLASIERFLFLESQIKFRCPDVILPGEEEAVATKTPAVTLKKIQTRPRGPKVPLPERKP